MTTLRQRLANQQNALKSTGPRSDEGKAQSRRNALRHGLSGAGIVLPDEEEAASTERYAQWESSLRPFDPSEVWLVERIAIESVRVDLCTRHAAAWKARRALRAFECWDGDRRAAVEELAARLPRQPALVASRLRQTAPGCDWLIARWEALGMALEAQGDWDEPRRALALDLLGVPIELRDGPGPLDTPAGDDPARHLAAIVGREVAGLTGLKEATLDAIDAEDQAAAMLGMELDGEPELKLLRRYESSCMRRLQWAFMRLRSRTRDPLPPPTPPPGYGMRPDRRDPVAEALPAPIDRPRPFDPFGNASLRPQPSPSPANRRHHRARLRKLRQAG